MDTLRPIVDWICSVELGHPTRVGLDGPSAAGKTTLADALAEMVQSTTNRPVIRASIDDFSSSRPQIPLDARGVEHAVVLRRKL